VTRAFWQLFAIVFSAVIAGLVWLVGYMVDVERGVAVLAGAIAFGGLEACMSRFIARHTDPADPGLTDPWEHGRELLHQEHVPAILNRQADADDVTRVLSARDFAGYRGERRSLKPGGQR
jgi:hypothetical protein